MSPDALTKLKTFSDTSNKTTIHEADYEKFREFIIQQHVDGAPIGDNGDVQDWLETEGGWSHEKAVRLASIYDDGRRLLSEYGQ